MIGITEKLVHNTIQVSDEMKFEMLEKMTRFKGKKKRKIEKKKIEKKNR